MGTAGDTDLGPLLDRARTLLRLGRNGMAERELRGILARDPGHVLGRALLALALAAQDRHDEALAEAGETVRLAPDHWYSHYTVAQVLLHAGRTAEAVRAGQAALAVDRGQAQVWDLLARAHLDRREWWHAEQAARQGLLLDPHSSALHGHLALALTALQDRAQAMAAAADALRLDPENAQAYLRYGRTALACGDHRAAVHAFRAAMRLEPDLEQARDLLLAAIKRGNPVYRVLSRFLLRFRSGPRPLVLLPLAPPLLVLAGLAALLHWVMWTAYVLTCLRSARGAYADLLFDRRERRTTTLACAALACGVVLLTLGVLLSHPVLAGACAATMALVTPLQEAFHGGYPPVRRFLYGWSAALAGTIALTLALSAVLPAAPLTAVTAVTAGAALGTVWLAVAARYLLRRLRPASRRA